MRRLVLILLLPAFAIACGGSERQAASTSTETTAATAKISLPSAEKAKEVILAAPEWSDYDFSEAAWTLPMDRVIENPITLQMAKDLQAAGWIVLDSTHRIALTTQALNDRRFIARPSGVVEMVPMAVKKFDEVESVHPAENGKVSVDFKWHWEPNAIGASFKSGFLHDRYTTPREGSASLQKTAGGWVVWEIHDKKGS